MMLQICVYTYTTALIITAILNLRIKLFQYMKSSKQ